MIVSAKAQGLPGLFSTLLAEDHLFFVQDILQKATFHYSLKRRVFLINHLHGDGFLGVVNSSYSSGAPWQESRAPQWCDSLKKIWQLVVI